jgi:hypothetical protein
MIYSLEICIEITLRFPFSYARIKMEESLTVSCIPLEATLHLPILTMEYASQTATQR